MCLNGVWVAIYHLGDHLFWDNNIVLLSPILTCSNMSNSPWYCLLMFISKLFPLTLNNGYKNNLIQKNDLSSHWVGWQLESSTVDTTAAINQGVRHNYWLLWQHKHVIPCWSYHTLVASIITHTHINPNLKIDR